MGKESGFGGPGIVVDIDESTIGKKLDWLDWNFKKYDVWNFRMNGNQIIFGREVS